MRNAQAVVVKKAMQAVGVGLLEVALEREGCKGCSPLLCTEPVALEPPYCRFDSSYVLGPLQLRTLQTARPLEWITLNVFAAQEDILSIGWMETVLRSLAVLHGPVAFELFGGEGSVWVRIAVPEEEVTGLRTALLGHFPALILQEVTDPFPSGTPVTCELVPVGPYHRSLSLLGREGASPLGLVASVLSDLRGRGVLQVLLQPADPSHDWAYNIENMVEAEQRAARLALLGGLSSQFAYDEVLPPRLDESVRDKVREDVAFYAVIARYAHWGTDARERERFVQGMRVSTGMVRFGGRAWRTLEHYTLVEALGEEEVREMVVRRLAHRPGLVLTSREVATLVHIPNARTLAMLPFEQRSGSPWLPLEGKGACLGRNVYGGSETAVVVPLKVRLRHTYVVGSTGSGKSKLLERLALDDAARGSGVCVVDPHGDLCLDVLGKLPEDRLGDVVYVSFGERGMVPKWNPFRSGLGAGKVADDVTRAFLAQAGTSGARMEHNFRMLAYIVHELGGTLDDFAELAARSARGEALSEQALARIENPQVQRFLRTELPRYGAAELSSVTNKLSRLLLDDQLGAMLRRPENELDPRGWMDEGRIVLVNLSSGTIGMDHARFVGSLLVSLIYRAAASRSDLAAGNRRPFFLYLDEVQLFQAATLTEILSEGRKYGLGAIVAHQERGQLGADLSQALGNCATKVIFRPGEDDLPYLRRVLGDAFDTDVLRRQGVGEALIACEGRVASLQTELTPFPCRRAARSWAVEYAKRSYEAIEGVSAPRRRPRVYDTFGTREEP